VYEENFIAFNDVTNGTHRTATEQRCKLTQGQLRFHHSHNGLCYISQM